MGNVAWGSAPFNQRSAKPLRQALGGEVAASFGLLVPNSTVGGEHAEMQTPGGSWARWRGWPRDDGRLGPMVGGWMAGVAIESGTLANARGNQRYDSWRATPENEING